MTTTSPVVFNLHDGTHVLVQEMDEGVYDFHLTRLNSEKHNFLWKDGQIEESYETRFDKLQLEAVEIFSKMLNE